MPSYLKALVVILFLSAAVFVIAKGSACAVATAQADFTRRRNLWFALTLAAFLAHSIWVFMAIAGALLFLAARREQNTMAMYFSVLFAVPLIAEQVPGFGIIQHFFTLHYGRLLALTLLLPAFLYLRGQPDVEPFGKSSLDRLLAAYLILQICLMLNVSTVTNVLRHGVFYAFLDVFLPYYVASRGVKNLAALRDILMAYVVAASVVAAIALFEWSRHWLLYAALDDAWGTAYNYGTYLERTQGVLRAQATAGQPIPLGYIMAVALGLYFYVRTLIPSKLMRLACLLLLVGGFLAPLSRGPWLGAAATAMVLIATSAHAGKTLSKLVVAMLVIAPALFFTSMGDKIIDYLPFVGSVEEGNVTYRQRLLVIATQVLLENPFFGAYSYVYAPAFQELRTGSAGFIDIVNSYVGIGLSSGLVGLSLFCGFFGVAGVRAYKAIRALRGSVSEAYVLGQCLLATLVGVLVTIFTVSSISFIPLVYWTLAGLIVAYARLVATQTVAVPSSQIAGQPARRQPYSPPRPRHTPAG